MRFGNMADSKQESLSCVIAFLTRILTLATVGVSIVCCRVNFGAPLKKEGMVKNALINEISSCKTTISQNALSRLKDI